MEPVPSACPLDCPDACGVLVERHADGRFKRVRLRPEWLRPYRLRPSFTGRWRRTLQSNGVHTPTSAPVSRSAPFVH